VYIYVYITYVFFIIIIIYIYTLIIIIINIMQVKHTDTDTKTPSRETATHRSTIQSLSARLTHPSCLFLTRTPPQLTSHMYATCACCAARAGGLSRSGHVQLRGSHHHTTDTTHKAQPPVLHPCNTTVLDPNGSGRKHFSRSRPSTVAPRNFKYRIKRIFHSAPRLVRTARPKPEALRTEARHVRYNKEVAERVNPRLRVNP